LNLLKFIVSMKRPLLITLYFSLLLIIVCIQTANAQVSYTWNGSVSTGWNTPGNWTPAGVPGSADNVTIVTAANSCLMPANETIANFKLTSGTLDMGSFTLTIGGSTATFTAGTVQNGTVSIPPPLPPALATAR
jgi:hypothetical protein